MNQRARTSMIVGLASLACGCNLSGSSNQGVRRFRATLTPTIEVQADMAMYLNQQKPKSGGGAWSLMDPLPDGEKPADVFTAGLDKVSGEVAFEINGEDFTMNAKFTGLPAASTVTDPKASANAGTHVMGDYWDIWMLSDVPNVVTIQMGILVEDPATPGTYTLDFDSRTGVDHNGNKMSVNNISSVATEWPGQELSLYDVRLIAMDVENASGTEEPSGQHRLNDHSPFSTPIDWTKPLP
jgi:hypothetical protein